MKLAEAAVEGGEEGEERGEKSEEREAGKERGGGGRLEVSEGDVGGLEAEEASGNGPIGVGRLAVAFPRHYKIAVII
jgi:hypothetical protein